MSPYQEESQSLELILEASEDKAVIARILRAFGGEGEQVQTRDLAAVPVFDVGKEDLSGISGKEHGDAGKDQFLQANAVGAQLQDDLLLIALRGRTHIDQIWRLCGKIRFCAEGSGKPLRVRQTVLQILHIAHIAEQIAYLRVKDFDFH